MRAALTLVLILLRAGLANGQVAQTPENANGLAPVPVASPTPEAPPPAAAPTVSAEPSASPTPPPATPEGEPGNREHTLFSAGLGYRTTNWSHFENPSNTNVTYNVNTATNTIVEGDIVLPVAGIRLGFSATPDGGISNASRYFGYLGFKGFSLKTETGNFSGNAFFSGQVAPGESRSVNFNQVYHYTELDYTVKMSGVFPWLFGLRYTTWNLPAEIALLSTSSSGPTILDPDFQSSFYTILSGFDVFKDQILLANEKPSSGFGVMGSFLVGIGFGTSQISQATAQNVQTIYGKTLSTTTPGVFTVHLSGQLGPKYTFIWGNFVGVIGVGYDINVLDLIAASSGDGSSTPANQLDPVAYPNFLYQGWILRSVATF